MKKGQKKKHFLDKETINYKEATAVCRVCGKVRILISKQKRFFKSFNETMEVVRTKCSISHKLGNWHRYSKILGQKSHPYSKILGVPEKIVNFGQCPLCGIETKLVLDHCHKQNKFRGFICNKCNSILGFANDNSTTLHNMISYLEKHNLSTG